MRARRGLGSGESGAQVVDNVYLWRSLGTRVTLFGNQMTRFWDVRALLARGFARGFGGGLRRDRVQIVQCAGVGELVVSRNVMGIVRLRAG